MGGGWALLELTDALLHFRISKTILVNRRTAWCNRRVTHKKGGICHRENIGFGSNISTEGGL